jgi:hypothetical protein
MGRNKRTNNNNNNNNNNNDEPPTKKPFLIHFINLVDKNNNKNDDNDDDCCNDDFNDYNNQEITPPSVQQNYCTNPKCDHLRFTDFEIEMGLDKVDYELEDSNFKFSTKDIENIDDLIELGYYYHCKKRTVYKDIDLLKLFNLIEPLMEMKKLVGMKSVKESMVDQILFFLQKLNKKERCNECIQCANLIKCDNVKSENDDMLHTIITGPPGVGKTELGKILGKVYKAMGILSKGHVNIARRPDLIAKYLGQTAPKTQAFIDKCKGGVMFIDEAYSLGNPEGRDSFAKECIDTINQNLTERRDFLCIIAGYENALENSFFSFNEGLKRRFSFRYNIDKYTGEELCEIFQMKIKKEDWVYTGSIDDLNKFFIKHKDTFPRFGGDIETLFLKTKIMHSRRIMFKNPNMRKKLIFEDIKKGYDKFTSHRKEKDDSVPEKLWHMYT